MDLKEKLAELRSRQGLTQGELASKINVSRQTVYKWERGMNAPTTEKLVALSRLYGVPLNELVSGEPQLEEEPPVAAAEEKPPVPEEVEAPPSEAVEKPEAPPPVDGEASGKRRFLITAKAGMAICCLAFAIIAICFFLLNSGSRKRPASVPIEQMDWEDVDITDPNFIPWDGGGWNVIEE